MYYSESLVLRRWKQDCADGGDDGSGDDDVVVLVVVVVVVVMFWFKLVMVVTVVVVVVIGVVTYASSGDGVSGGGCDGVGGVQWRPYPFGRAQWRYSRPVWAGVKGRRPGAGECG